VERPQVRLHRHLRLRPLRRELLLAVQLLLLLRWLQQPPGLRRLPRRQQQLQRPLQFLAGDRVLL
jgi:hypothetical protein